MDMTHSIGVTQLLSSATPPLCVCDGKSGSMVAGRTWAQWEWMNLSVRMVELLSLLNVRFSNNRDHKWAFIISGFFQATGSQVIQLEHRNSSMLEGTLFIFSSFNTYIGYAFIFPTCGTPVYTTTQGLTEYLIFWYIIPHDIALHENTYFLKT